MKERSKTTAIKFLGRQLRDLQHSPLPNVTAMPKDESDLTVWQGTIVFPDDHEHYPSLPLHFQMSFTADYPSKGPELDLLSTIRHSHVYFPKICFSLLPDFREFFEGTATPKTAFWNPTRSIRSFLEDLASFLIVDADGECTITRQDIDDARRTAAVVQCPWDDDSSCSAATEEGAISPEAPQAQSAAATPASLTPEQYCIAKGVDALLARCRAQLEHHKPDDPALFLRQYLALPVATVPKPTTPPPEIPLSASADLCCSISGQRWDDDGVVLGFGVYVELKSGGTKFGITSDLTAMSRESFVEDSIRTTALGSTINAWIPFVINHRNWTQRGASAVFREAVADIARRIGGGAAGKDFLGLSQIILTELWKTKIVELMQEDAEHASEKVLNGLCAVHHLLLAIAAEDDSFARRATKQIATFIEQPRMRTKHHVSDWGRFLPLLLLSDINWLTGPNGTAGLARHAVQESMTRNALWIQKEDPALANTAASPPISDRVDRSWPKSKIGMRLMAFQVRYLLARPSWVEECGLGVARNTADEATSLEDASSSDHRAATYSMFNALGGRPSPRMIRAFQDTTKRVQAIDNFGELFACLGCPQITRSTVHDMLLQGMQYSAALGYHGSRGREAGRGGRRRDGGRGGRGGGGGRGGTYRGGWHH